MAKKVARFTSAKQAKDVVILNIKDLSNICDYFVICSGESMTQVKAIYNYIIKKCKEEKIKIQHTEGGQTYNWVLVDFSDVMLHIFIPETREFYNLEYLWKRAEKVR